MSKERFDFLTKERLLDNLKTDSKPRPEVADALTAILREEAYARYFFRDLDNEAWLLPLSERGVFSQAPGPIPDEGGWRFPRWPAARYLQRVAAKRPSDVAAILRRIRSDNPVVSSELVEALWAMPPAKAASVVPAVLRWLEHPDDLLLTYRIVDLIRHLAEGEQLGAGLKLLNALLQPELPESKNGEPYYGAEVRSQRDRHQVEELLKGVADLFPLEALERVLPILEKRLKDALRLEKGGSIGRSDFSSGWRPAIEDHEQNRPGGYKSHLVLALRDVLVALPDTSPRLLPTLNRYVRSRRSIFRRLALHRARVGGRSLRRFRRDLLLNARLDSDSNCLHELYLLRSQCFSDLTHSERKLAIDRLSTRPKRRRGESKADYQHRSRATFVKRLGVIEKWLFGDIKRRYKAIVREHGKPEHPDFLMYTQAGFVSETSPKEADELKTMPLEEIVELLQVWVPGPKGTFLSEESRLGLARELQSAVRNEPQRFVKEINLFAAPALHGMYVQHLLDGLREALKDGKAIDWDKVIDFCEQLLTSDLGRYDTTGDPENESRGSWVASAMASLLEEAYKAEERAPRGYLWERTERIFEVLARDPEPDEEYEATYGGSNMDPFTLSLNTARGRLMHALFSFARHVALAETDGPDQASAQPSDRRLRPGIRTLLESQLDKTVDPSEAVHSVFGVYLPLLLYADRQWTLEVLPRIFPSSPKYWWAAFESHIMYGQFQAPIYKLLQTEYRRGIEEARATRPERSRLATFEEQLGKHMAAVFWHGLEDVRDPTSNLALFFERSADEARSTFVWLVWRALQDAKPDVDSDQWRRCKALWEYRAAAARASDSAEPLKRELESYAWWLNETQEDVRTIRDLILVIIPYLDRSTQAGNVIEYLDRQVETSPSIVTDILRKLVESGHELYLLSEHQDGIRHILRVALASGEKDADANALAIINHYEQLGDYSYGALVE